MLEFGTDNEEITKDCPNAPFVISINDNADNEFVVTLP